MKTRKLVLAVLVVCLPVLSAWAGQWTYNSGSATLSHDTSGWGLYASRNGTNLTVTGVSQSPGTPSVLPLSDPMPGYAVVSIGSYAFSDCTSLMSITIPASVTSIGSCAFSGCTSLMSIYIPNSVISIGDEAFSNCTNLSSIHISNSVTAIGNSLFQNCIWLMSVTIPASVTSIGSYVFQSCYRLTSVTIPDSVTSIGTGAFSGSGLTSLTLPAKITSIPAYTFYWCPSLTSVTIPDSVTFIGDDAFQYCTALTSIAIPANVISIASYAFYGCSGLTAINVVPGNSVYTSADGILYNKSQTTLIQCPEGKTGSITIPASVTSIGSYAFFECYDLTAINVSLISATYASTNGILYNKSLTSLIQCPGGKTGDITIPASVTSIVSYAFYGCSGLASVTIPDSVTSIGPNAFYHCSGLTSVIIPNSVTSIGGSAFSGCNHLTSVTIPASVTIIDSYAFAFNTALASVLFTGDPPSSYLASSAFNNTPVTLYYLPAFDSSWPSTVADRPAVCWNPAFSPVSPPSFTSGTFGFTLAGNPNLPVKVEAATNLSSGVWAPITNATLNSSGSLSVTDPASSSLPVRFYRIVWP